jgi:23S rRNA (guanosine2251-2'-O)-methyltransferase
MILVLDSVRSKENVGSIFRTADATGVTEVVVCGITPQPVNRFGNVDSKIAKASLGAESSMAWRHEASCRGAVWALKQKGYCVIVLEQTANSVDYKAVKVGKKEKQLEKTVLVVGNEVDGVSSDVCSLANVVMHIPMHGKKESLNVAVATGIALFSLKHEQH